MVAIQSPSFLFLLLLLPEKKNPSREENIHNANRCTEDLHSDAHIFHSRIVRALPKIKKRKQ